MAETYRNTNTDKKNISNSRRSRWSVQLPKLPRMSSRSRSQERNLEQTSDLRRETKSRDLRNKISFWKRKSASITDYDPTYRVIYLGNVLTGWAKGDGCVDKPLSTLWRNHISSDKPDIMMKMTVVGSGLRANTNEHGLTEYWANRITYCTAHPSYPRVFCWIYRHEGRKMKQELRCHAVLCPKEEKARQISGHLQDRLHQALVDFKKEKISRQNARLSLANSIHENPSMPYRKLLLQAGTSNYKPPIERSKSAPKLTSIEEADMEEEEFEESDDEECTPPSYNVAMFQVHRNPTIVLDSTLESRIPVPRYTAPGYSDDNLEIINERFQDEDDTDNEDEITDYIGSAEASESPSSQSRGTLSCSPRDIGERPEPGDGDDHSLSDQSDSGHGDGLSSSLGLIRISDQDTISDESGYSEEPSVISRSKDVTVVKVNLTPSSSETPPSVTNEFNQENFQEDFDPSVITSSTHKLEIQLNDSSNNNNNSPDLLKSRSNWCQPISIEIDPRQPIATDLDSDSGSAYNSSQDSSPRTQPTPLTPTILTPLSLSPTPLEDDLMVRTGSPNVILSPSTPRDGVGTPSPRSTDLTVKSVFLSEFTASEKLRYIDRSNVKNTKNSMVLNRQEFCINI